MVDLGKYFKKAYFKNATLNIFETPKGGLAKKNMKKKTVSDDEDSDDSDDVSIQYIMLSSTVFMEV
jgi:hypothetical protein